MSGGGGGQNEDGEKRSGGGSGRGQCDLGGHHSPHHNIIVEAAGCQGWFTGHVCGLSNGRAFRRVPQYGSVARGCGRSIAPNRHYRSPLFEGPKTSQLLEI